MRTKTERGENRRALPKFFLTMLGSLAVGGLMGFLVGCSRVFGLDTGEIAGRLDGVLRAAMPWGIPVTTAVIMGTCVLLYRSAARKFAAWDGGDENEMSASADILLSWVLLLSAVQLLVNFFFMTAVGTYQPEEGALAMVGVFVLSCGCVIFAQQKVVDLERRMNPEKRGSVYDGQLRRVGAAADRRGQPPGLYGHHPRLYGVLDGAHHPGYGLRVGNAAGERSAAGLGHYAGDLCPGVHPAVREGRGGGMRDVSLVIQGGIGSALAAGGIYLLLRNREGRNGREFAYAAACVLAGVFLLGYAVCRIA